MPLQYFGCFPLHLLFLIPSCHHTAASVSACLPVANKASPLFVWALLLEREAGLQINFEFVSIRLPQLNDLTPYTVEEVMCIWFFCAYLAISILGCSTNLYCKLCIYWISKST